MELWVACLVGTGMAPLEEARRVHVPTCAGVRVGCCCTKGCTGAGADSRVAPGDVVMPDSCGKSRVQGPTAPFPAHLAQLLPPHCHWPLICTPPVPFIPTPADW